MYLSLLNAVRPFICGDGLPVRRHLAHCPVISWSCMLSKRQTIPCGDGTCRSLRVRPQPVTQHSAMAQPTLDLVEDAIGAAYYPVAVGLRRALPLKNESAVLRFQWKAMLFFQMHQPSKSGTSMEPGRGEEDEPVKADKASPLRSCNVDKPLPKVRWHCKKFNNTGTLKCRNLICNTSLSYVTYICILYIIRCTICENKGNF